MSSMNQQSLIPPKTAQTFAGDHLKNCPPPSASTGNATFFRILVTGEVGADAFIPRANLPGKRFPDTCSENAISLCPTLEGARRKRSQVKAFENKPIAKVSLTKDHGPWKKDNEQHVNWWKVLSLDPTTVAEKVQEAVGV
jgi:hypothetical protein